jgi:predicted DCC family thiol-disulfide oxidoreductase YuxK
LSSEHPIWLFDGVCVLCSGAVQYVLKHECNTSMRFVAIQSGEGKKLALHHGINPANPDSFLFICNGQALTKSDGVLALLAHVKGPARVLRVGVIFPRFLRDWIYDHIARNRYQIFGRAKSCMVPTAALLHRFTLPELSQ